MTDHGPRAVSWGTWLQHDTAVSVGAGVGLQAALLVSGVLAARMLGVEGRGHLALVMLVPLALSQALSLGLPLAVVYEISRHRSAARTVVKRVTRVCLVQAGAVGLLHAAVISLAIGGKSADFTIAAFISLLVGPAMLLQTYGLGVLQGLGYFLALNILRLAPFVLYSVALVALVVATSTSLVAVTLAFTIAYLVGTTLTCVTGLRRLDALAGAGDSVPSRRAMLGFGAKSFLGWASPIESLRLDQAVVGLFLSPIALGLYVVGLAFTNLPRFLAQSVGIVAYPHVAAEADRHTARRSAWQAVALTSVGTVVIAALIAVFSPVLIPAFFGEEFAASVSLTQILLIGAVLLSMRRVLTDAARGLGMAALGSAAEVASWATLVPLIPLLIGPFGVKGVAYAFVASAALSLTVLILGVLRHARRENEWHAEGDVGAPGRHKDLEQVQT